LEASFQKDPPKSARISREIKKMNQVLFKYLQSKQTIIDSISQSSQVQEENQNQQQASLDFRSRGESLYEIFGRN
jgi:transposase-like protein